ncbi:hypothetical protein [Streptomyces sp. NPDC058572]|uniref:hypothetical protein n=1 Tax=Streptomyces sp. NPDC058572 TaxID=3346546 RepID=UPI0036688F40
MSAVEGLSVGEPGVWGEVTAGLRVSRPGGGLGSLGGCLRLLFLRRPATAGWQVQRTVVVCPSWRVATVSSPAQGSENAGPRLMTGTSWAFAGVGMEKSGVRLRDFCTEIPLSA